jgi:methoxymalonate biosynthesis acyl carrier protein
MNEYLTEVDTKVRSLLSQYQKSADLTPETDIFAAGFVNSLFAMQLVTLVEREFKIEIANDDLDLANFRSIVAIGNFVHRKKSTGDHTASADARVGDRSAAAPVASAS